MKFLRVGICALVVFGVAAHGGVEDWARAVLETVDVVLALGEAPEKTIAEFCAALGQPAFASSISESSARRA